MMLQIFLPSVPIVGVFAPVKYMVVKIARSYSKVVLQTTKLTTVYTGSTPL
jgi:hypothetical protein